MVLSLLKALHCKYNRPYKAMTMHRMAKKTEGSHISNVNKTRRGFESTALQLGVAS